MGTNDLQILIKRIKRLRQPHENFELYNYCLKDVVEVIKKYEKNSKSITR